MMIFGRMAHSEYSWKQNLLMVMSFCIALLNFSSLWIEARPFNHGSRCRQRCQGEYSLCSTQAADPDIHMVCVLAKDLCRAVCKKRRYQRTPFYNNAKLIGSSWLKRVVKRRNVIPALSATPTFKLANA